MNAPTTAFQDSGSKFAVHLGAWRRSERARLVLKLCLLAAVTFLVMYLRRPDQFLQPAVWVEDGTINIVDYATSGWLSLFHPIQGYFSLPIKFLHALAQTLSFRWLPELGLWLSVLFAYGVLAVIATAPTTLKLPFACAVAVLLIPADSEAFAVSLYSGWWGSLLALPPLFWRETGRPRSAMRLSLIAVGGLSSPLIIVLAPLFALRAAVRRSRIDYIAFAVCAVVATLQILAVKFYGQASLGTISSNLPLMIEKFFGYFVQVPTVPVRHAAIFWAGVAVLTLLVVSWLRHRQSLGLTFILVVGALGAAIAATIIRIPIEAIHPKLAGPRYFFYPFIFLSWALVQVAALERDAYSLAATIMLALAGRNALDVAQRRHTPIDWRAHVEQCLREPQHSLPVHFAGTAADQTSVQLTNQQCRNLVGQSWFDNKLPQ